METVLDAPQDCNPRSSEHCSSELPSLADFFDDAFTGDYAAIPTMFASASSALKHPKLHLTTQDGSEMVLKLAVGPRTRYAGSVHITLSGVYYASISPAGYLYSRRPLPNDARALLAKIAADPIAVTLEQGQMRGRCSYCNLRLSDPRSVCHGRGKRCSEVWGLHWDAPRAYRGMFGDAWSAVSGAELVQP
jgi:hypothetical protein